MATANPHEPATSTPAAQVIRVLIVDDHPVVRLGLRAMVETQPDMVVVGEAGDGPSSLRLFEQQQPDVTLMDLRMPGESGPEVITRIRGRWPDARIIVLTSFDGDEDIFRAVKAGARGYLLKGTFPEGTLEAIRYVYAGQRLIAPELALRLAERVAGPALTAREVGVLELVAKGMSNKEIAAVLFVAEDTVKNHLKHAYSKLGVSDRTGAALLAVQRGILRLE
jgi:two-component system NarL family response regulator